MSLIQLLPNPRSRTWRGGTPCHGSEGGARGRLCSLLPGGLGIMSPGIMTGVGGASLDWDRRRRVTPVQTASQEAWPEADLGDEILLEMRAVVERRQACALQKGARRIARCGGCDPAFAGVPLPSIYFVARMERSVIRERWSSETAAPDCAALHPGYKTWRDGRSE